MYKVGEVVRIIDNTTGHEFKMGELVRIIELDPDGLVDSAEYLDGSDFWYVDEDDIEKVEENK